ncbi:MAG: hypothetical protein LBS98_05225 [Coriobacteriales bacterium]|jgi:hypothetical protein|nr:hypothetical protein [Coriobacteriales bacterium]
MIDLRAGLTIQLAPYAACLAGSPLARVLTVKGVAGAAEQAGGAPFSGEDGSALKKSLAVLGWSDEDWCGVLLALAPNTTTLTPGELRELCEIIDPTAIITLDEVARQAVVKAFVSTEEGFLAEFTAGAESKVLGRRLISVDGFEASLADPHAKQRVWAQLKRCVP